MVTEWQTMSSTTKSPNSHRRELIINNMEKLIENLTGL
jgi:hypothetical protein